MTEASFPAEVIAFFNKDVKIEGWEVSRSINGTLPSPLDQFINKIKKKENEVTYTVSFEFKKEV